ncbi:tape measure protein [Actinomadura rubrisoli]|uniref:aggregation-promoting factor C-terminal-like domain-containing protein n=1 Tax=Actinomadura rubrisoli TaxID=2530368 RepID=UPI001404ED4B
MAKLQAQQVKAAQKANDAITKSSEDAAKSRIRWDKHWYSESQKNIEAQRRLYHGLFDEIDRRATRSASERRRAQEALGNSILADLRRVDRAHAAAINEQNRRVQQAASFQRRTQQALGESILADMRRIDRAHAEAFREQARRTDAADRAMRAQQNAQANQIVSQQRRISRAHAQAFAEDRSRQEALGRLFMQDINRRIAMDRMHGRAIQENARREAAAISEARRAMEESNRAFSNAVEGIRQYGNRLQSFGQSWTSYVTAPILGSIAVMSAWGLQTAATIEKARMGVESILVANKVAVSTANAATRAALGDLRKYAEETSFSFGDMANGVQRLIAAGVRLDTSVHWMKVLGDAAATGGAGVHEMQRAIIALTQSINAQRITAQDMNQLQNASIPIWMILQQIYKKNRMELLKMAKAGELNSEEVWPKVIKWMERYRGNAKKMADAIPLENLKNKIEQFKNSLADVIMEPKNAKALNNLFNNLGDSLEKVTPVFSNLVTMILPALNKGLALFESAMTQLEQHPFLAKILLMAAALGPLAIGFGLLARTLGFVLGPFAKIRQLIGKTAGADGRLRGGLLKTTGVVRTLGKSIMWLTGLGAFGQLIGAAAKISAVGIGRGAKATGKATGRAVGGLFDDAGPTKRIASGAKTKARSGLSGASGAVSSLVGRIPGLQKLTGVLGKLKGILRSPWGIAAVAAIVAALVAFGVAVVGAWKKSEAFRSAVGFMWFQLKDIFSKIKNAFGNVFGGENASKLDTFGAKFKAFGDWMTVNVLMPINTALMWVRDNFGTLFAGAVLGFQVLANVVIGNVTPILQGLWSILGSVFKMIGNVIGMVVKAVKNFLSWAKITDGASSATGGMTVKGGALGKTIVLLISTFAAFGKLMNAIVSSINIAAQAFAGLFNVIGATAKAIGQLTSGDFKGAWNTFKGGFGDSLGKIWDAVKKTGGKFKEAFDLKGILNENTSRFNKLFDAAGKSKTPSKQSTKTGKKPKGSGDVNTSLGGSSDGEDGGSGSEAKKKKKAATKKKAKSEARKKAETAKKRFDSAKKTLLNAFSTFLGALKGNAEQVKKAGDTLVKNVENAFDKVGKSKAGDRAVAYLKGVNAKLVSIAKQRDAILAKIDEAKDFQKTVTSGAKDAASLGNLPYSNTTAEGVAKGLQERLAKIKQFVNVIKTLAKRGLNKSLLRQVVDMGPVDGLALGNTLLAANKSTWAAINSAQSEIDKTAAQLGSTATQVIFGSVKELQKKGASLQAQMDKIARDAIRKVAKTFGIGWNEIRKITGDGMSKTNRKLNDGLTSTKKNVQSATTAVKSSWSGMVKDMNQTTSKMVTVTYGKGAQKVVNTMASIAGTKNPLPNLGFKYSTGGVAPGYAPRRDTVPAMLSPGEGVIVPELTRQIGPAQLHAWNKAAMMGRNVFATGGVVDGAKWVDAHKDDPFEGYADAMKAAFKGVLDPAAAALGSLGKFGSIESGDFKSRYPDLMKWAKELDKRSFGSAAGVIKVAASQIGEGDRGGSDNNLNKYNQFNGEAWCADFISWIVDHAKANKAYFGSPTGTPANRWPAVATWIAQAGGKRPVSQARPGDLATYGGTSHINLVVKNLGGGRLLTIGGNQGPLVESGVRTNADGVLRPKFSSLPGGSVNPWPGSLNIPTTGHGDLGGGTDGGGGTPSKNRALGRRMLSDIGLGSQWSALDNIWTRESNWNHHAMNPSSGAYGIPQALPASKMRSAGADWHDNPATQIRWGLGYIRGRYGSPNGAWSFWRNHHWYEDGAWSIPSNRHAAMLHRGEMVVPSKPAESFRDALKGRRSGNVGGDTYNFTLNNQPGLPSEKQVIKAMSYAHTLYGRR